MGEAPVLAYRESRPMLSSLALIVVIKLSTVASSLERDVSAGKHVFTKYSLSLLLLTKACKVHFVSQLGYLLIGIKIH